MIWKNKVQVAKTHIQCDMNQQCHTLSVFSSKSRDHVMLVSRFLSETIETYIYPSGAQKPLLICEWSFNTLVCIHHSYFLCHLVNHPGTI